MFITIELKGYLTVGDFAKAFSTRDGRVGCNRSNIWNMVKRERAKPNSTKIDVLLIAGIHYVKFKATTVDLRPLGEVGKMSIVHSTGQV